MNRRGFLGVIAGAIAARNVPTEGEKAELPPAMKCDPTDESGLAWIERDGWQQSVSVPARDIPWTAADLEALNDGFRNG